MNGGGAILIDSGDEKEISEHINIENQTANRTQEKKKQKVIK